jgi:L-amino acid N-acyltransferase YncA
VTDDGIAHSILSGVFDSEKTPGFGLILLSMILTKAEEKGAKKIVSAISSNNLPVVRTHVQLGFEVKDLNYVFIRHLPKD